MLRHRLPSYYRVTGISCLLWFICIPLYKPFMMHILGFADTEKLFGLVMLLLGSYVFYVFQNIYDSCFYGCGRTDYMLYESLITNGVYYGFFFALFICGRWTPSLRSIALLFAGGNIFDSIVSVLFFRRFMKSVPVLDRLEGKGQ